jgi:hypothetical protein
MQRFVIDDVFLAFTYHSCAFWPLLVITNVFYPEPTSVPACTGRLVRSDMAQLIYRRRMHVTSNSSFFIYFLNQQIITILFYYYYNPDVSSQGTVSRYGKSGCI